MSLADESGNEPKRYAELREALETSAPRDLRVTIRLYQEESHISTAVVATLNALTRISARTPRAPTSGQARGS